MKELFEQIKQIVRETGDFLKNSTITTIDSKTEHADFVTDLDVKVQNILVERFKEILPEAGFICEESDITPELSHYTFIIDPIDGTTNFINGFRISCISVALVKDGKDLMGVVYNPFMEEFFCALKGEGAFLNGKAIKVTDRPLKNSVIGYGTAVYYDDVRMKCIEAQKALMPIVGDFRRIGSAALDLCYVASGRVDAFFEYRLSPWDYAAGTIIAREAGGFVENVEAWDFDYSKKQGIIAGGPNIFNDFKQIIKSI